MIFGVVTNVGFLGQLVANRDVIAGDLDTGLIEREATSLVSGEPSALQIRSFHCDLVPASKDQITWRIGPDGFDMVLSGEVPKTISASLHTGITKILGGRAVSGIRHWAIHPGGRSVIDAVEDSLHLPPEMLSVSREVLRNYGNTSSASIMFVLKEILENGAAGDGCALAFGPGLGVESMSFAVGA